MEHAPELRDLYLRLIDAYNRGDSSLVGQLLSQQAGMSVIGTDPDEWWSDYRAFTDAVRSHVPAQRAGMVQALPGEPEVYREGTVGWIVARPIYRVAGRGDVPARMTVIVHQEDGRWKVVQQHISIGISNAEVMQRAGRTAPDSV
jgi:hypothetical protein